MSIAVSSSSLARVSAKVDFIAVSNQGKTTIQTFLENHEVTFSVAVDGYDNATAEYAEKKSLPWFAIVTGEGVFAWEGGTADEVAAQLKA